MHACSNLELPIIARMQSIPDKEPFVQVRVPKVLFNQLRGIAGPRGMSAAALIRELIQTHLDKKAKETAKRVA